MACLNPLPFYSGFAFCFVWCLPLRRRHGCAGGRWAKVSGIIVGFLSRLSSGTRAGRRLGCCRGRHGLKWFTRNRESARDRLLYLNRSRLGQSQSLLSPSSNVNLWNPLSSHYLWGKSLRICWRNHRWMPTGMFYFLLLNSIFHACRVWNCLLKISRSNSAVDDRAKVSLPPQYVSNPFF